MARKRYYQTEKDRMDESRGMDRYERRTRKDSRDESRGMKNYYAGFDDKKRRELEDGNMIREDRGAIANLPQNVVYRQYGYKAYGTPEELMDDITGVDRQMEMDDRKMQRFMQPEKY